MTAEQRKEYKKQNEGIGMAFFPLHFFGNRGGNAGTGSSATAAAKYASYGLDDDDDEDNHILDIMMAVQEEKPAVDVPPLNLPGSRPTTTGGDEKQPSNTKGKFKKVEEEKMARSDKKIANFKSYNVSSWREELIRKKAAALESVSCIILTSRLS